MTVKIKAARDAIAKGAIWIAVDVKNQFGQKECQWGLFLDGDRIKGFGNVTRLKMLSCPIFNDMVGLNYIKMERAIESYVMTIAENRNLKRSVRNRVINRLTDKAYTIKQHLKYAGINK